MSARRTYISCGSGGLDVILNKLVGLDLKNLIPRRVDFTIVSYLSKELKSKYSVVESTFSLHDDT